MASPFVLTTGLGSRGLIYWLLIPTNRGCRFESYFAEPFLSKPLESDFGGFCLYRPLTIAFRQPVLSCSGPVDYPHEHHVRSC